MLPCLREALIVGVTSPLHSKPLRLVECQQCLLSSGELLSPYSGGFAKDSQFATQGGDTVGAHLVRGLCLARPPAERGLSISFHLEPAYLGYFCQ
jgi:hypothetical protein